MYTSNGDLHLELPSGEDEGLKQLWVLAYWETDSFLGGRTSLERKFLRMRLRL